MTDDDIENGVNAMRWAAEEIKRLRAEVARLHREMELQRMQRESPFRGEPGKPDDAIEAFIKAWEDEAGKEPDPEEPPEEAA